MPRFLGYVYRIKDVYRMWETIGLIAAACTTGGLVPQLIRGVRTKSLNDVSPWLLGLVIVGTFLWFLYGTHLNDRIIMGANAISFVIAVTLFYLRCKYQAAREEQISTIKEALEIEQVEHSKT